MTGKIEQHKVIRLSTYQEELTELALQLIASRRLTRQIDHMLRLPSPTLRIDEQFI